MCLKLQNLSFCSDDFQCHGFSMATHRTVYAENSQLMAYNIHPVAVDSFEKRVKEDLQTVFLYKPAYFEFSEAARLEGSILAGDIEEIATANLSCVDSEGLSREIVRSLADYKAALAGKANVASTSSNHLYSSPTACASIRRMMDMSNRANSDMKGKATESSTPQLKKYAVLHSSQAHSQLLCEPYILSGVPAMTQDASTMIRIVAYDQTICRLFLNIPADLIAYALFNDASNVNSSPKPIDSLSTTTPNLPIDYPKLCLSIIRSLREVITSSSTPSITSSSSIGEYFVVLNFVLCINEDDNQTASSQERSSEVTSAEGLNSGFAGQAAQSLTAILERLLV